MAIPRTRKAMAALAQWATDNNVPRAPYYSRLLQAWPKWCAQHPEYGRIYRRAQRMGKTVDHIVPLSSPLVCGLHVPWNLQVLPARANIAKSNDLWPGHPCEPRPLFEEHPQYALPL